MSWYPHWKNYRFFVWHNCHTCRSTGTQVQCLVAGSTTLIMLSFFVSSLPYFTLFFFPIASPKQGMFLRTPHLYANLCVCLCPIKSGTKGWTSTKRGKNVVLFYITPHQQMQNRDHYYHKHGGLTRIVIKQLQQHQFAFLQFNKIFNNVLE